MKNTSLAYMYRDADNFKQSKVVILAGEITDSMLSRIKAALGTNVDQAEELGSFIPGQVGLPDLQNQFSENEITMIDVLLSAMTDDERQNFEAMIDRNAFEKPQWNNERDHIWHEMLSLDLVDHMPTVEMRIEDFVSALEAVTWDENYKPPFYEEMCANFEAAQNEARNLGGMI